MSRRTFIKKTLSVVAGVAVGLTATPVQCRENRNNGTTDDMFGVGVTMAPDGEYISVDTSEDVSRVGICVFERVRDTGRTYVFQHVK